MRRDRTGFSLIEMLVVICVVSICMAIVAPKFRVSTIQRVSLAIGTVLRRGRGRHGERAGATRQQQGLIDAHVRLTPHFVLPSQLWRPAISRR